MDETMKLLLLFDARQTATGAMEAVQGGLLKILGSAKLLSAEGEAKLASFGGAAERMGSRAGSAVSAAAGGLSAYEQQMAGTTAKMEQHLAAIRQASTGMATTAGAAVAGAEPALAGLAGDLEGVAGAGTKVEASLAPGVAALGATGMAAESVGTNVGGMRSAIGGAAIGVGAGFLAIGAAAGLMAKSSISAAKDFQEGLTTLVTGAGEAKTNIDLISAGVLKMAGVVGVAPEKLVEALYPIESAGYHGAQALQVLQASAEGAKVGMADQATVADALTTVMKNYGLTGKDAAGVTGQIIAAVAQGKMHMQDFAGSLSMVLPVAASLHIPFQQVAAAVATLTANGIPASRATRGLSTMLTALVSPTKAAQGALKEIGLSATDLGAKITSGDLPGAMTMLEDHLGKKFPEGSVQYDQAIKTILGSQQALRVGLDLLGPHLQTFQGNVAAIGTTVQGAAKLEQDWALVQEDLNTKTAQAKAQWDAMQVTLGMALIPMVTKLLEAILPVLTVVSTWVENNPKLAATILAVSAAVGILGGVLLVIGGTLLVFTTILTGPIILAVAGVVAAIAGAILIFKNWGTITETVGRAFEVLGSKAHDIFGAIVGFVQEVNAKFGFVIPIILTLLTGPVGLVAGLVIVYKTHQQFRDIVQAALSDVGGFFNALGSTVASVIEGIMGKVNDAMNAINGLRAAASAIGSIVGGAASAVGSAAHNAAGDIPHFATGTAYAPGGLAWVGEHGRELVNLPRGSQVFPHGQALASPLSPARGGGGSVVVNVNYPTLLNEDAILTLTQVIGEEVVRQTGYAYSLAALGGR